MDADDATLAGEQLQRLVRHADARHDFHGDVAAHDWHLARLDHLHLRLLGAVGDIDQDAEPVHLGDQGAALVVDAVEMVGVLAALLRCDLRIGEGVEAGLGGELDRAQAEPVEGVEYVDVALVVPARFAADEHRHAARADHLARLLGGGDDRHLVLVLLGIP